MYRTKHIRVTFDSGKLSGFIQFAVLARIVEGLVKKTLLINCAKYCTLNTESVLNF